MRKLIVTTIVSLDGFVEGPGGNVMALPMDSSFDAYCAERLGTADTLLLGRRTFDMFRGFWPAVVDAPQASEAQRQISRRDNAIDKLVITDSAVGEEASAPWTATSTMVPRADARATVERLKAGEGGDILTFGSRTVWNDLLEAGSVDELHVMVGPVVLGGGTPAFGNGAPPLTLLDTRTFPDSANVVLRYQVGDQPSPGS